MTPTDELDILDTWLTSAAWDLLQQRWREQWGPTGERFTELIVKFANATDKVQVTEELQRVIWVQKEIEAFFRQFPARRAELKAKRDHPDGHPSRRGVL